MSDEITFRYVGVPTEHGEISGFCAAFGAESLALDFFRRIHSHLTSGSQLGPISVRFDHGVAGFDLVLDIPQPKDKFIYRIKIEGIDSALIDKLVRGLSMFGYYFILAGYSSGPNFEVLPAKRYHLFKKEVYIDGRLVLGASRYRIDWASLFG